MIQAHPIFSDSLEGYVRLAIAMITASTAGVALVGWWLKKGSDRRVDKVEAALNGIGKKVNDVESDCKMSEAWRIEQGQQRVRDDADRRELRERLVKVEANMERFTTDIHEHHRDLRELLEKNAREQLQAVHRVELEMAELKGQNNVGEALKEMGKSIERAVIIATHRESQSPGRL